MIFVWVSLFKNVRRVKTYPGEAASVSREEDIASRFVFWGKKEIKKRNDSEFKDWGRNPFVLAEGITAVTGLNLIGILWDADSPQAIINEEIVRVGDRVEGNEVVDILKDRVILHDGEKEFELRL